MAEKLWLRSLDASNRYGVLLREHKVIAGLGLFIAVAGGAIGLGALAASRVIPQSMNIVGYVGHLGEWELTAALSKTATRATADLAGPLQMKHVGFCGSDGPEVRTGEMRIRLSRLSSSVAVKLQLDGVECSHSGDLSDASIGTLVCPGRKSLPLTMWIK